jgi:hypothetical protein
VVQVDGGRSLEEGGPGTEGCISDEIGGRERGKVSECRVEHMNLNGFQVNVVLCTQPRALYSAITDPRCNECTTAFKFANTQIIR